MIWDWDGSRRSLSQEYVKKLRLDLDQDSLRPAKVGSHMPESQFFFLHYTLCCAHEVVAESAEKKLVPSPRWSVYISTEIIGVKVGVTPGILGTHSI